MLNGSAHAAICEIVTKNKISFFLINVFLDFAFLIVHEFLFNAKFQIHLTYL